MVRQTTLTLRSAAAGGALCLCFAVPDGRAESPAPSGPKAGEKPSIATSSYCHSSLEECENMRSLVATTGTLPQSFLEQMPRIPSPSLPAPFSEDQDSKYVWHPVSDQCEEQEQKPLKPDPGESALKKTLRAKLEPITSMFCFTASGGKKPPER